MGKPLWRLETVWPTGDIATNAFQDTPELKDYLNRETFCTHHKCPIPKSVTITRLDQDR